MLDRLAANVLAVHFKLIERAKDRTPVAAVASDEIEHRKTAVVTYDDPCIDW